MSERHQSGGSSVDNASTLSHAKTTAKSATAHPLDLPGVPYGVDIPFVHLLGFRLVSWGDGLSELAYQPAPEHLNSFGVTHGGASMALLDVAMAVAARSVDKAHGVVTIEMKTSFMQPAHPERGPLRAQGKLIHRTKSTAFAEATLLDASGHPCAHATGTFRYVPSAPAMPEVPPVSHVPRSGSHR